MKSLVLIMLLAAAVTATGRRRINIDSVQTPEMVVTYQEVDLTDIPDLSVLTAATPERNLSVGNIGNSKLVARSAHIRKAGTNILHVQDVRHRSSLRITAIRVRQVGPSQGSTSYIRAGGVGSNSVTIRLQSRRGGGYHYVIEIYGR